MSKLNIAVLPGDGIGPEITEQALNVTKAICAKFGHELTYEHAIVGACAIDAVGEPYPQATHDLCMKSDAVLFGAIGDPKYDNNPNAKVRPEQGLLKMRKELGLYANIRPVTTLCVFANLPAVCISVVRRVVAKMEILLTILVYILAKRWNALCIWLTNMPDNVVKK